MWGSGRSLLSAVVLLALTTNGHAGLTYRDVSFSGGKLLIISGEFSLDDDPFALANAVLQHSPTAVSFDSPGGNIYAAMEIGRAIRKLQLPTIQIRATLCASACALAFMGGTFRIAEAGSIGVHKTSFGAPFIGDGRKAVSEIQSATADMISYISEMGVDPGVLQLALSYDSDDMRYLSLSEMRQHRIITEEGGRGIMSSPSVPPPPRSAPSTASPATAVRDPSPSIDLSIPTVRSGTVRDPDGGVEVLVAADPKSQQISYLPNGSRVSVVLSEGNWYRIIAGSVTGFVRQASVMADVFAVLGIDRKFVQIKSFSNFAEAEAFAKASSLKLAVHLASNGWFAVTLDETFPATNALDAVRSLKKRRLVPKDSVATYGNTYVRKVCCQ